jgi:hypothetical protein
LVIPPAQPLKSANLADIVPEWDAKFVDLDQEVLFELVLAANYMDIKSLLDLSCAKVASMVKGKTPDEIRKTFNIKNDFTPEVSLCPGAPRAPSPGRANPPRASPELLSQPPPRLQAEAQGLEANRWITEA